MVQLSSPLIDDRRVRRLHQSVALVVSCWLICLWPCVVAAAGSQSNAFSSSTSQETCHWSSWGPFTPCTRVGLHLWAHSHSKSSSPPAAGCPPLTETTPCEVTHKPAPRERTQVTQQAVSSLLINLPLASAVALSNPQAGNTSAFPTVTPELAAALQAGRQLWQQQASSADMLQCAPFNGDVQLLRDATSHIVGVQQQLPRMRHQLHQARAAFAATAKAVAYGIGPAVLNRTPGMGGSSVLQPMRDAATLSQPHSTRRPGGKQNGVMPSPVADATAIAQWNGSSSLTAAFVFGRSTDKGVAHTSAQSLLDGVDSIVPWMDAKVHSGTPSARRLAVRASGAPGFVLNMTYDHSLGVATLNAVSPPAGGQPGALGGLLLAVQQQLTGIYGLDLSSSAAKARLMDLPTTDAVVRTNAGGGVDQLGLYLAGTWAQANLTAALGLAKHPHRGKQQQGSGQDTFTVQEPVLLYSAAPAALYVAVQTDVAALSVSQAPAVINLKPGGAAALQLFEPCTPVKGLQLTNVELQLEHDGNLTGIASGTLAATAVSAIATVSAAASDRTTVRTASGAAIDSDLSMVMTAETVGAGKLADVITIITHRQTSRRAPIELLHHLEEQQHMQFSSVTLTYSSPKSHRSTGIARGSQDSTEGEFALVAEVDVTRAPALQQMLDAIGLTEESLTLRTSSMGSAFAAASQELLRLQLPGPFTMPGPTSLTLQYAQESVQQVSPADTLLSTALVGSTTVGIVLPGVTHPVLSDLGTVQITTPTAIVGVSGTKLAPSPVNAELSGQISSPFTVNALNFLQFGTMNVSATAGFEPPSLKRLQVTGPVTAFGVAGTAEFTSSSLVVQPTVAGQQVDEAALELHAVLPTLDVGLLAKAIGSNLEQGALNAQFVSFRALMAPAAQKAKTPTGSAAAEQVTQLNGALSVAAELHLMGMSSYVNFDMNASQTTPIAATFVAGQINKVLMPGVLSAVSGALRVTLNNVQSAQSVRSLQAATRSVLEDAQQVLAKAQQHLDTSAARLNLAKQKATSNLQQALTEAESASSAYLSERSSRAARELQARDELNAADAAFNNAKTTAYKSLNTAQQAYKEALTSHSSFVKTAQEQTDTLLLETWQLRARYNAANMLCSPTDQGLESCKAAAAAWVQYQDASKALDAAETSLQEAATSAASAQELEIAKASFASHQAAASEVIDGPKWSALVRAGAKFEAATAAVNALETGPAAAQMRAAHAQLVTAQEGIKIMLSPAGAQWQAVRDAKDAVRAAHAGVRSATAVARLTTDEIAKASADLNTLLSQIEAQRQGTRLQQEGPVVRLDEINVRFNLEAGQDPFLISVSYSGAVGTGDLQQSVGGVFQAVVSADSDELLLVVSEVLRDDILDALRATYRSLSSLL